MSVAVLPAFSPLSQCSWPEPAADEPRDQTDIWNAIQSQKDTTKTPNFDNLAPYVHPLFRRSSSMLSQESLELCTESLGSETGSADFSALLDLKAEHEDDKEYTLNEYGQQNQTEFDFEDDEDDVRELTAVNYHCSIGRRSPARSFPPPLPSISRRDGPCLSMRPHRRDGRLVVEAVAVPSQNYLHAQREGGRLLLSFVDAVVNDSGRQQCRRTYIESENDAETQVFSENSPSLELENGNEAENHVFGENSCSLELEVEEDDEDEDVEEVEVVDRGTVVEVKVSTQPQPPRGATAAAKVHRSSLVINKFVGGMPAKASSEADADNGGATGLKTSVATAAVAAAAVSASSTECHDGYSCSRAAAAAMPQLGGCAAGTDDKLVFASKLRNRGELLHNMKRCSQLRRPLFIWEPYCIVTST